MQSNGHVKEHIVKHNKKIRIVLASSQYFVLFFLASFHCGWIEYEKKDDLTQCQSLENEMRDVRLERVCRGAREAYIYIYRYIREYTKRYHHRRRLQYTVEIRTHN